MFDTIFGLPVHALVVHATVVIVPGAALAIALTAMWPPFRRWAGLLPLLLSALATVLVPISTSSGEQLERRVEAGDLVEKHAELGEGLLLPVLILLAAAVAWYWVHLKEADDAGALTVVVERTGGPGRPATAVMTALTVIALLGSCWTVVQVARIGHSGAQAAWTDVVQA